MAAWVRGCPIYREVMGGGRFIMKNVRSTGFLRTNLGSATCPHHSFGGTDHPALAPILPCRLAGSVAQGAGPSDDVSPIGEPNSSVSLIERDVELTQDRRTDITDARTV